MKAKPTDFFGLFFTKKGNFRRVWLPLFQRRYCWNQPQIKQLFEDIKNFKNEHRMGNIILISKKIWFEKSNNSQQENNDKNNNNASSSALPEENKQKEVQKPIVATSEKESVFFCVDGQQRILSLTLFLASIRDLILEQFERIDAILNIKSSGSRTSPKNETFTQMKSLKPEFKNIASKIEAFLFGDKESLKKEEEKERNSLLEGSNQKDVSGLINSFPEGKRLEFLRFLPSFYDRKPYYQATILRMQNLKQEIVKTKENTHLIIKNRTLFDILLREFLKSENSPDQAIPKFEDSLAAFKANFEFLNEIQETIFKRLSFIMFKVISREDCQVVYQQLYLVSQMTKAMSNPSFNSGMRFGLDLTEMDLCKNYLLAFFHAQEDSAETLSSDFYFNHWLSLENTLSQAMEQVLSKKSQKIEELPPIHDILAEFFTWFETETEKTNSEFYRFQDAQKKAREQEKKELLKKYKNYEEIPGKLKWKFIPFFSAQNYDKFRFFVSDYIEFQKQTEFYQKKIQEIIINAAKMPQSSPKSDFNFKIFSIFSKKSGQQKDFLSEEEIFREKRKEREMEKIEQEIIRNLILDMKNAIPKFKIVDFLNNFSNSGSGSIRIGGMTSSMMKKQDIGLQSANPSPLLRRRAAHFQQKRKDYSNGTEFKSSSLVEKMKSNLSEADLKQNDEFSEYAEAPL